MEMPIRGKCIALLLLIGSPLVVHSNALQRVAHHDELCGTRDLTAFERALDLQRMNGLSRGDGRRELLTPSCEELCKQCIEIETYFHMSGFALDRDNTTSGWVIPHPSSEIRELRKEIANRTGNPDISSPGRFSTFEDIYRLIQDNVNVLNDVYAGTPFRFKWINSDPAEAAVHVQNDFAFFYAGKVYQSNDYATQAHRGDRRTLNVYLNYRICGHPFIWVDDNCRTIGAATNPSYQLDGTADGVYLAYDTLTGGGFEGYDTGISLAHEVGHWLGLLHVFESETLPDEGAGADDSVPCDAINVEHGDFVADTAFLPKPSVMMYKCSLTYYEAPGEEIPDSCPNLPGVDPVFNIMNYVGDEECLAEGHAEITCGQSERMMRQWLLYRDHDDVCAQGEMEVNVTMKLDADFPNVHAELAPFNGKRNAILNFERDLDTNLLHALDLGSSFTRIMNFCLPGDEEYVMVVTDAGRDGFVDGYIDLAVNGAPIQRVQGDFGATECIKFGADGIKADMRSGGSSAEFGDNYHFDVSGLETGITCSASKERYMEEPVPISASRFMRIEVALSTVSEGVCINDVTKLDIAIDGSVTTVYPRDDDETVRFDSKVIKCRSASCIVEFDLERLEGIYDPRNGHGMYNTTCRANVVLGFGGACDDFLRDGKFDCSESHEVFTSGEGDVAFSMPVLSAATPSVQLAYNFVIIACASTWMWMQLFA